MSFLCVVNYAKLKSSTVTFANIEPDVVNLWVAEEEMETWALSWFCRKMTCLLHLTSEDVSSLVRLEAFHVRSGRFCRFWSQDCEDGDREWRLTWKGQMSCLEDHWLPQALWWAPDFFVPDLREGVFFLNKERADWNTTSYSM